VAAGRRVPVGARIGGWVFSRRGAESQRDSGVAAGRRVPGWARSAGFAWGAIGLAQRRKGAKGAGGRGVAAGRRVPVGGRIGGWVNFSQRRRAAEGQRGGDWPAGSGLRAICGFAWGAIGLAQRRKGAKGRVAAGWRLAGGFRSARTPRPCPSLRLCVSAREKEQTPSRPAIQSGRRGSIPSPPIYFAALRLSESPKGSRRAGQRSSRGGVAPSRRPRSTLRLCALARAQKAAVEPASDPVATAWLHPAAPARL